MPQFFSGYLRTNNFQPMFEQSWRLLETFEDGSYWTRSPYSAQYWNNVGSILEQERIIGPWLESPGWLCLVREVGAVLERDSRILWRSEGGIYVWTKWNGRVRLHVGYIEGWVLKYVKYALESIVFFHRCAIKKVVVNIFWNLLVEFERYLNKYITYLSLRPALVSFFICWTQ